jgi:predicted TIM-barrel fold metal-dependent hydrolase
VTVIIDVHAHLGYDCVFEEDFTAEELLIAQEENGIDITIVQPGTAVDLATVQQQHDDIAELCARHAGRFYGMANPNPHLPSDQYRSELARCVRDLGFVGVKIHPLAHALATNSQPGRLVFEAARELGIPVAVHTGPGVPFALPSLVWPMARQFPDLSIAMFHSGLVHFSSEALLVAEACPNVYLEGSWTGGYIVRGWVRALGAHRVMFGSDHGDNAATELVKFRTARLTAEELDWCLGATAAQVFGLPHRGLAGS